MKESILPPSVGVGKLKDCRSDPVQLDFSHWGRGSLLCGFENCRLKYQAFLEKVGEVLDVPPLYPEVSLEVDSVNMGNDEDGERHKREE